MSDQTPSISDVLVEVRRLGVDFGQLRVDLTELRVDFMARRDRQQDALSTIRDDFAVNFGRADQATDCVKGLRAEFDHLTSEVAAMERQIQRLQSEVRQLRGDERGGGRA